MATDCEVPVYVDASWKGVPFNVLSSSDEFGRRGHVYEYPLANETGYKDLGRKAKRFKVEGYLIGGDQVAQTVAMSAAAESPEPGMLMHPMFGPQLVACVTLTTTAEYRENKRRTKLSFDFVEAMPSLAPYLFGAAISALFAAGSESVFASTRQARWAPTTNATAAASRVSYSLAEQVEPATDEESFDAIDMLHRDGGAGAGAPVNGVSVNLLGMQSALPANRISFLTLNDVVGPIDNGSATVRRIHADAMKRLRKWNSTVVSVADGTPSVESLIVSARLAMARDYALTAAQMTYATVSEAMADLDFVMAVYDDEEAAATLRCDDALVTAVRKARATAAQTILSQNIRLPGIVQSDTNGVWPSLVVAHKLYSTGKRHTEVENYNPRQSPFFMGRQVVAPAPGAP